MCSYSYFPRVEGMLDDGINAFSMEFSAERVFRNQPVDIQECFKAYGVENYVDMLGKNEGSRLVVSDVFIFRFNSFDL